MAAGEEFKLAADNRRTRCLRSRPEATNTQLNFELTRKLLDERGIIVRSAIHDDS
jgi:hypothetical protein